MGNIIDDQPAVLVFDVNVIRQVINEVPQEVPFGGELVFDPLQLGDVARNAKVPDHAALFIAQRHLGGERPGSNAVGHGFFFNFAEHRLARCHDLLFILPGGLSMFRREKIEVRLAHRFAGMFELELLHHRAADPHETALLVLEVNPIRQVIQQRVKEVPFVRQGFFGALAFQGVTHRAHQQPAVHLALDQIILRARVHRLDGQRFIVPPAQNNNGCARRGALHR